MTIAQQPPDKSTAVPPQKNETKPPLKTEGKTLPKDESPAKPGQETTPAKDTAPAGEPQQPVIPFQQAPPAIAVQQPKQPPKNFEIGSILFPALWLIGALALGAIMLSWLKKYRERNAGAFSLSANEQLSAFRQSMEEGEMTDDEFKKVKALLGEKLRKPANPVTTAPGQASTEGETPQTNSPKS